MKAGLKSLLSVALTFPRKKRAKSLFPTIGALSLAVFELAIVLLSTKEGRAQSALDGFDPGANSDVFAVAVQADGKIVVGGQFNLLGGGGAGQSPRNRIGRLNHDGTLDTFDPGADANVMTLAVRDDGKILVGGFFSKLGGNATLSRPFLGLLESNGDLDTSFDPVLDREVLHLAIQPDGKIVVGGAFQVVDGLSYHRVVRLTATGEVDLSFVDPNADGTVHEVAVQPDGKIIIGGEFRFLGALPRSKIARLNPDGTIDTTFNPGADSDANVEALAIQPDGKILVGGNFTHLGNNGTDPHNGIARLNPDGTPDPEFIDNGGAFSVLSVILQPDGRILVGGGFQTLEGEIRASIGRLQPTGEVDLGFNPGAGPGFLGVVVAMAVQPEGNIVVGGRFEELGRIGTTLRQNLGRLYPDGSPDDNFDPGANDEVRVLAVQPDGKILAGGFFTQLGNGGTTTRNHIGRLSPDGTLDLNFNPDANDDVKALVIQPNGKIIVGGSFTLIGGDDSQKFIARLTPDGVPDPDFVNPAPDGQVLALALQPDGKILLGGSFDSLGGFSHERIGRLLVTGDVDPDFNPGIDNVGAPPKVEVLAVQPDEKILVGGDFTTLGGGVATELGRLTPKGIFDGPFISGADNTPFAFLVQPDSNILIGGTFTVLSGADRSRIGRLIPNGAVDDNFNPGAGPVGDTPNVIALGLQTDGRILAGGGFKFLGDGGGGPGTLPRQHIGRLTSEGVTDEYDPGADEAVRALTMESDGKVVVGGSFSLIGGGGQTSRSRIARLTNTEPAFQQLLLASSATVITWLRSGASPEVDRVTFELSTNGITFTSLATPARIAGGWQLSGQNLPVLQNFLIRARGFYATGKPDGGGQFVESIRNFFLTPAPVINSPLSATAIVGQLFTYQISATNAPTTFDATNLPSSGWLTRDTGTGLLAGTPSASDIGSFPINISATNAGGTDTKVLGLTVDFAPPPPQITSPGSANGVVGQAFNYQITATNNPTSFDATPLPSGLVRNTSNGLISGTPTQAGDFDVTVSATNPGGTGSAQLALTIGSGPPPAPVITSGPFSSAVVGIPFSYQVTATNSPTSFDATGLPLGLTAHTDSGVIDGSPTESGGFSVQISATNAGGTGSKTQNLNVGSAEVLGPTIISPLSVTAIQGQPFSYPIIATGSPTSYDATGLPLGLAIDPNHLLGIISGTPAEVGIFDVNLTATNADGSDSKILHLEVQPAPLKGSISTDSVATATGRVGVPFSFQVIVSGASAAARLSATGLPPGLTYDPITGEITGTPLQEGGSAVDLIVTDGNRTTTSTLGLTFSADPAFPLITSPSSAAFVPGQTFTYQIAISTAEPEDPLTFALVGNLPAGLRFIDETGTIVGTPQVARALLQPGPLVAGGVVTNVVSIFACNSTGCGSSQVHFYEEGTGAVNISTRLKVGTGDNVLIGGFIIQGNAPMKVLLRAIGPSLSVDDSLPNPFLELHDAAGAVIGSNDDWKINLDPLCMGCDQSAAIKATTIPPTKDSESAVLAFLASGSGSSSTQSNYTAVVKGKDSSTGVGLVEIYNLAVASLDSSSEAHLVNISTRGYVQKGNDVMIGGFINKGSEPVKVLLRAIGPSLADAGLTGALADPILELHNSSGAVIAANDNWKSSQMEEIVNTTIPPSNDLESAIVVTLPPTIPPAYDSYTAIVRGVGDTSGVALVEAYFGVP